MRVVEDAQQQTRQVCETLHQWGLREVLCSIGRERALAWIASGKIKSILDLFTGSEEPEMRTYFVPSHAAIYEQAKEVSRSITSATNACEVDVQDMDVLQDIGLGSSTDFPLKREPQSDEDKCNQRVNEFLAKLVTLLRTLQDQSNAVKALILEASKNKFVSQLSGDFDAFLRMLMRVIKVVEESVTSPPARYDIQKLLKMADELDVWSLPLKDACTAFLASRTPVKDPSAELE